MKIEFKSKEDFSNFANSVCCNVKSLGVFKDCLSAIPCEECWRNTYDIVIEDNEHFNKAQEVCDTIESYNLNIAATFYNMPWGKGGIRFVLEQESTGFCYSFDETYSLIEEVATSDVVLKLLLEFTQSYIEFRSNKLMGDK